MLTRKPRKGDRVRWPDWPAGRVATVVRVEDSLCYIECPSDRINPFIWFFPREQKMNELAEIVEESWRIRRPIQDGTQPPKQYLDADGGWTTDPRKARHFATNAAAHNEGNRLATSRWVVEPCKL